MECSQAGFWNARAVSDQISSKERVTFKKKTSFTQVKVARQEAIKFGGGQNPFIGQSVFPKQSFRKKVGLI